MRTSSRALSGIIAGLLAICSVNVHAQDRCGTMPVLEANLKNDPILKARFLQQEQELQRFIAARAALPGARADAAPLIVPIVFHIVMPNPYQVTDEQVQAQVDTLNKIYAGLNADTSRIPGYFKPLFGRVGIQFALAQRTPAGKPTTGINRYYSTSASFSTTNTVKHASTSGADAWNTSLYLNVWLCPLSGGLLGYATFPNTGASAEQGVVIEYRSLPGGVLTNYNGGKTMAHEIGHYFNLYHIWGDDGGACTGTDYVGDTPNQGNNTSGAPTGKVFDGCTPGGNGIMYQNYMDYTDDRGMEMFTVQQVARMQAAATTYRSALFTSTGATLIPPKTNDAAVKSINTPSKRVCTTGFTPAITLTNNGTNTITSLAISARIDNGATVTTTWTGSAAWRDSFKVPLPGLITTAGAHTLTVYTGAPNGNADEIPADDTLRMSLTYYDALTLPFSESFEGSAYPPAGWDILNDDGTYTWEKMAGLAKTGSYSVAVRNYYYPNTGASDYLRLPQLVIGNADSAFMTFRVAAGANGSGITFSVDTLEVLVSTDCGANYTSVYKKSGASLYSTTRAFSGAYSPQDGEWRKDSINLASFINKGNILIAFRNVNEQVNNIYLDDINVYSKALNANLKNKGFLVSPSPTTGLVNIDFYPSPGKLQGIAIYSLSGQMVLQMPVANGEGANHYQFNLGGQAAGIYVVKVVYADRVVTQKIFKN